MIPGYNASDGSAVRTRFGVWVFCLVNLSSCTSGDSAGATQLSSPTTSITASPNSVTLAMGGAATFVATAMRGDGSTYVPNVIWAANGGSIDGAGLYTAGNTAGSFRVIATQLGGTLADTSAVTITPPVLQAVILTPASVTLFTGATRQFSVSGEWSDGSMTAPAVTYSATGGNINGSGLYTAGTTAGTFRVIATESGGTLADTSTVTLMTPTLQAVILSPASTLVYLGYLRQFSVSGQWSDGSTTAPAVTYSATGGTIISNGLYTAGGTSGNFRVIATVQGGTLVDTSVVTLSVAPPPGPNEPAGYVPITEQPWTSLTADGWYLDQPGATLATDITAMESPSGLLRAVYPTGYTGGGAPFAMERVLPSPNEVYYRIVFKHSGNWVGHPTGVNKLGYLWMHNNPTAVLEAVGTGSGALVPQLVLQGVPQGETRYPPNLGPSGVATRGEWHTLEVQLVANTSGVANGIIRTWLDGIQNAEYTNVVFAASGQSNSWEIVSVFPIWGGLGGVVSATMTLDVDHVYLSGR